MARIDDDSWDLASSVGATATMVAAARALASKAGDPLIDDPFADPLVRAVGVEFFIRLIDGEITVADVDDGAGLGLQQLIDWMAVRTRFFDDFFTAAGAAGIRQAVILASGLDSRPYRLRWPAGTVVYEVDQPEVIEFKTTTLSELGAAPTAERRTVAIDLREDWPAALRDSGFDDTVPTAWSAEGLLMYLPPDAQDRLFDNITALSAAGSQLGTEFHRDAASAFADRANGFTERWGDHGFTVDLPNLIYQGERNDVVAYLAARNWRVSSRTRVELFAASGLSLPGGEAMVPFRDALSIIATLN
jgi:methyltransferase (TIGR00027 family)